MSERDAYPKLKLRIERKPDVEPVVVHCDICHHSEHRWSNSDDGLPVCGRCRTRERIGGYSLLMTATYRDVSHLVAGSALVRAIHDTAKLQRAKAHSHE